MKKLLVPCITFALSALALQACTTETDTGNTGKCVPNSTQACTCTGTDQGVQTCQANGAFNECNCSGSSSSSSSSGNGGAGGGGNCHDLPNTPTTCGNGMVDIDEQCDDGNCVATDACNNNCQLPYCGDGVITPSIGETCEGEVDCSGCGIMMTSSSSSSSSSGDPCMGKLVFAGLATAQAGAFSYGGQIGLDAATAACQAIGAFGMCDYQQWKQIQNDPVKYSTDVMNIGKAIMPGQCEDVWLQRTTDATGAEAMMCPGGVSAPGPGGRCNNWNYKTGHRSNGEHVIICNMGGTITYDYKIDCDTIFDDIPGSPHVGPGMPCSSTLEIPCCFELCISPSMP